MNKKEFGYSNSVMRNNPKIQLIDMRERLPKIDLKEAIKEWYLVPHMNEKWSINGHRMYANLIADLLMQHPLCANLLKHKEESFA